MNKKKTMMLPIVLVLQNGAAFGQDYYQWIDLEGRPHFSDQFTEGSKSLQVDPGYSFYTAKKIHDGDTLLLSNGQRVRLLGVNAPEIGFFNNPAEPLGAEAKLWLEKNLSGRKVRVETDLEKKDKYGRTLATLYTEEGINIAIELLKQGLAVVVIHPPNIKYRDQLVSAQTEAKKSNVGIWGHTAYFATQIKDIKTLDRRRWQRILGTVTNIKKTKKNIYLQLSGQFSLKIKSIYWDYFVNGFDIYKNKNIEVNGWIKKNKSKLLMPVKDPSAIRIVSP